MSLQWLHVLKVP